MDKNYNVVDLAGNIVNTIVWDGVTPYEPGDGMTLVEVVEVAQSEVVEPERAGGEAQ